MTTSSIYEPAVPRAEHSIALRGVNYSDSEWGDADAPLVVYLHGWADVGSTFQFLVDQLTGSWRVVAPDWRGFGRSS